MNDGWGLLPVADRETDDGWGLADDIDSGDGWGLRQSPGMPARGIESAPELDGDGPAGGAAIPARGSFDDVEAFGASGPTETDSWVQGSVFNPDAPAVAVTRPRRRLPVKVVAAGVVVSVVAAVGVAYAAFTGNDDSPAGPGNPVPTVSQQGGDPATGDGEGDPTGGDVMQFTGKTVPGFDDQHAWKLDSFGTLSRGVTRLGLVLVGPEAITLTDITTGEPSFSAVVDGPITKTFVAQASPGGDDTLFWVTDAYTVDTDPAAAPDADGNEPAPVTVPGKLWWVNGSNASHVGLPDGCEVSAAGTGPLVTCSDAVYTLGLGAALDEVPVGDGMVALGVIDGTAVVAGSAGISIPDGDGTLAPLDLAAARSGSGEALTLLRVLGMGASGVVSVWGSPETGAGGRVEVVTHSLDGAIIDQAGVDGTLIATARLGRSVGGARGFIGPVVVDHTDGTVETLPDGCEATDGQGVVVRVECEGFGAGFHVDSQTWIGSSPVAATTWDGQWALLMNDDGSVTGHTRS